MDKVFGIDLGTTYSCIAQVDEFGKPVVLTNFEGERITPSVIYFENSENIVVGNQAKEMLKTDPEKVVSFVKRDMGNPDFVCIQERNEYKPEELSSYIIKKLAKDASEKVGYDVKDVVITCPAYFGINEKEATKAAGVIAGLNVLSIINEPTAAALTFGFSKEEEQVVLVYDLGGGTFDVTMIEVKSKEINVVVTGGDHNLGGKNWDNALMGHLANKFKEETGIEDDIFEDKETFGDLQLSSEDAKKALTKFDKTKVRVLYGTERATIEVTKEEFNELTSDLLERTIMLTNEMLTDAEKKGFTKYDKILMVGGSTRMPQIRERLEKEYIGIPVESFDPDESVAKGAAIYGQQLLDAKEPNKEGPKLPPKKTTNVVSKSFGVQAYVNNSEQKIINLIKKQTVLPATINQNFGTYEDNQESVEILIFENEVYDDSIEIENGKEIRKGVIEGLPENLPGGSPIEVTFFINEEGLLEVKAVEKIGNNELLMKIETTSVIKGKELKEATERNKGIIVT